MSISTSLRSLFSRSVTPSRFQKISAFALTAVFGLGLVSPAAAATYTGTNLGAIADGGAPNNICGAPRDVQFAVAGFPGQIGSVSVSFTGTMAYLGDFEASLIAPNATTHLLFSRVGTNVISADDYGDGSLIDGTYSFGDLAASNFWTVANATAESTIITPGSFRTQAAGPNATDTPGPALTSMNSTFVPLLPANVNGTWTLRFRDCAEVFTGNITAAQLTLLPPSAGEATLGGRVTTSNGAGIRSVTVTLSGGNLAEPRVVTTGAFGNYRFEGLDAGQSYIVNVSARRYTFAQPSVLVSLQDNISDANFVAN